MLGSASRPRQGGISDCFLMARGSCEHCVWQSLEIVIFNQICDPTGKNAAEPVPKFPAADKDQAGVWKAVSELTAARKPVRGKRGLVDDKETASRVCRQHFFRPGAFDES